MNQRRQVSKKFCRKLPMAVAAVLRSRSIAEAAQSVDISESTLKRWQRKPEFADALHAAQEEFFVATTNNLRASGVDATEVLIKIVRDSNTPPSARVRGCMAILNFLFKVHESDNVEMRLAKIEAALKRRKEAHT